jgi:hypothetical protein
MTGGRRNDLVEARADLILGGQLSAAAYAAHFEGQMPRGRLRTVRWLHRLARAGRAVARFFYVGSGDFFPSQPH